MPEYALMARPRSEEKRSQLLDAAANIIAQRGDSAPTALIAKAAGVAEGSLFTYFKNKGELLTELHKTLTAEAFSSVPSDLRAQADKRKKLRSIWTSVLRWALSNPKRWTALRILGLSSQVDEDRRQDARNKGRSFVVEELKIRDSPPGFPTSLLRAIIDVTIELTQQNPRFAKQYSVAGFEALWRALSHE